MVMACHKKKQKNKTFKAVLVAIARRLGIIVSPVSII